MFVTQPSSIVKEVACYEACCSPLYSFQLVWICITVVLPYCCCIFYCWTYYRNDVFLHSFGQFLKFLLRRLRVEFAFLQNCTSTSNHLICALICMGCSRLVGVCGRWVCRISGFCLWCLGSSYFALKRITHLFTQSSRFALSSCSILWSFSVLIILYSK